MVEFLDYPTVKPNVVQEVVFVDRLERRQPGFRFRVSSLPGHTIQCVISGRTHLEVSGRHYDLKRGTLVWFHEDELMEGRVVEPPWSFYTLNFHAPSLSPPPIEARVRQVGSDVLRQYEALLGAWRDTTIPVGTRELRVGARVLDLLTSITTPTQERFTTDPASELWWELERALRRDLTRPISLPIMEKLIGRSQATIARSCLRAVGMPPMKRVKQIRLSLAWGLVVFSDLQMKEIASRIGYTRVHEFSRDYRKYFQRSPTKDRQAERQTSGKK